MALDPREIREMLVEAARTGETLTYKEVIERLGFEFNTNLVGQLGRALDRIEDLARAAKEPPLAVLVVRQSDRLPGQGWWVSRVRGHGYKGEWTGEQALKHVTKHQQIAFDYWKDR
jgi:hypothetical protein